MKVFAAALLVLGGTCPAFAQNAAATPIPLPRPAAAAKPPAAKAATPRATYDALPATERIAIQSDLIWTGDLNSTANGEFGDRSITAVKEFQKRSGGKDTGILTAQERTALAHEAQVKQAAVGWRLVTDPVTGIRLGLPGKLVPQEAKAKTGTRWQSARGEVQIETFRETAPATVAAIYELQRKDPSRKVQYSVLRPDFFVLSGLQGLKKFYMRAHGRDNEVRGLLILYDQAMEGILEPAVVAMSSAFAPFPANVAAAGSTLRRKVEYATGVVVSASGDILTDREAIDGCHLVEIAGLGSAVRGAEDKTSGLALLRLYGVGGLKPLPLGDGARREEVTLVGIADPETQAGNAAASAQKVHVSMNGDTGAVDPAPTAGFAGAAAIDGESGFVGIVTQKPQVIAGLPAAGAPVTMTSADAVRRLLAAQNIAPAAGRASVDFAKDSVVRVICVRQ